MTVRWLLGASICLTVLVIMATQGASAQTPKPMANPTDAQVIDMLGGRLKDIFKKFGFPVDVTVSRSEKQENDGAVLDYNAFGFKIRDKQARIVYFWQEWTKPVHGIRMGDARSSVVAKLGASYITETNKDGVEDYGWQTSGGDAYLWVVFDKDDLVKRIQFELR